MKLSRKSWHYRLQGFFNFTPSTNICQHFWKTSLAVLLIPFLLLFSPVALLAYITEELPFWLRGRREKKAKQLTPQQVFLILLGRYSFHDIFNGNYSFNYRNLRYWSHSVSNPKELIRTQAELYKARSLKTPLKTIKRKVKEVIATYFTYLLILISGIVWFGSFSLLLSFTQESGISILITVVGLAFVLLILLVLFPIVFLWEWKIEKFIDNYERPIEDDLFTIYLKAVKNKMCPLIEWKD